MQRISSWTDLVSALGLFRYGSLTAGVPPTPLKAEWLNMVQEEMANFILAFLPELDAADSSQMLKALERALQISLEGYALQANTLAGYGIGDAYTKAAADTLFANKANKAVTLAGYSIGDAYTKAATDLALSKKANNAITLAGYGIGDAYTKSAIDVFISGLESRKQDKSEALLAANGWHLCKATGRLEQWGSGLVNPDSVTQPINFPRPFGEIYNCFGNKVTPNSTDGDANSAGARHVSVTQYQLFNDTQNFAATVHWRAIGKAPGY